MDCLTDCNGLVGKLREISAPQARLNLVQFIGDLLHIYFPEFKFLKSESEPETN